GLDSYVDAVVAAVGERDRVIVVGHSLGGFTAPLAATALHADGVIYLAGMSPLPGESFAGWWLNTGHDKVAVDADPSVAFFNGVPAALAEEARSRGRDQQGEW